MENIFQAIGTKKQSGVNILLANKMDFQPKGIKQDKKGHYTLIKGKMFEDELSRLNIYAPNARMCIFTKESLLKLKAHIAPHNNRGRLQHLTLRNGLIMETETK